MITGENEILQKEKTKQNKTLVLHGTSQSEEHAQV